MNKILRPRCILWPVCVIIIFFEILQTIWVLTYIVNKKYVKQFFRYVHIIFAPMNKVDKLNLRCSKFSWSIIIDFSEPNSSQLCLKITVPGNLPPTGKPYGLFNGSSGLAPLNNNYQPRLPCILTLAICCKQVIIVKKTITSCK